MSNDERKSPPLSETHEVVKKSKGGGSDNLWETVKSSSHPTDKTLTDVNSTLEISFDSVPPFKFAKSATTDAIVNVDVALIDFDSFQYVRKETLVKALIYMIKNVDDVNKDLSSVTVPEKAETGCQFNGFSEADQETSDMNGIPCLPNNQVDQLNVILKEFQSSLLKSVDEKLSFVDTKISDAISYFSNDGHVKSFSEIAAKAAKNVETIAQSTIINVENAAKQTIDIVNAKNSSVPQYADIVNNNIEKVNSSGMNSRTQTVFISNKTVIETPSVENGEVLILSNTEGTTNSSVDVVKKLVSEKFKKIPFDFANAKSKSKKVAIRFHNKKAKDQGIKIMDESNFLTPLGYTYENAAKLLPKITLSGVPRLILSDIAQNDLTTDEIRTIEKDVVVNEILQKNRCIDDLVQKGHTFQIIFVSKNNNSHADITVGIKVSPAVRAAILTEQSGYIFLAGKRVLFKDRFHVKQCYHCQQIGHMSTDCPEKDNNPTCLYCMGTHRSSACTFKQTAEKHCCAKCQASKNPEDASNYMYHNSASLDCPVLVRECKRLASITDFASKNVL